MRWTLISIALTQQSAQQMALHPQGQQIFRFDIFGDEALWTDRLRMHEVIASALDPTIDLT
ncbi:MAG: lipoprotein [Polaromonas sp.]|nr:lipoprotein [Polaromonas sp.]